MFKISIIIPVYNVEIYLKRCLDSVTNQTLKDIEIILINDGSTDNSLKICKEYSNKDKRIKIIDKENGGASSARNIGILYARGEYISFVDSDDWIELNMMEDLYNLVELNKAEFCMCNYIKENGNKNHYVNSSIKFKILKGNKIKEYLLLPLIEREDNQKKHALAGFRGPCGKLYKRGVIKKYNIKFQEDLIIGEDLIFNLEFLIHINSVVVNNEFHYHYLTNNNSVTMKYKDNCWPSIYRNTIIYLEKFLNKYGLYYEAKDKLNKLIIKYLLISLRNEMRKDNSKKVSRKINTINEILEDKIVRDSLKKVNLNQYEKKDKFILRICKLWGGFL